MQNLKDFIVSFYFPKSFLPPSFVHGILGFVGAEAGVKIANTFMNANPLFAIVYAIIGYIVLSTAFGFIVKLVSTEVE